MANGPATAEIWAVKVGMQSQQVPRGVWCVICPGLAGFGRLWGWLAMMASTWCKGSMGLGVGWR
jgi:hypothetical protein